MESAYLDIIILLIISYILDNKLLPQVIIMFTTIAIIIQHAIAGISPSDIPELLLYVCIIIYAALKIYSNKIEVE